MFCQYIYLWMYVIPAADLHRPHRSRLPPADRAVQRVKVLPAVRRGCHSRCAFAL